MCPYIITSFFFTLSHEDGQTVYLQQKDTAGGASHPLAVSPMSQDGIWKMWCK